MRKMLFVAGAAIAALSMPAFGQGHGHAGAGGGLGVGAGGGLGGPPASVPVGPPAGIPLGPPSTLPEHSPTDLPGGPPATIPPSDHANANASGQVQGDVHAQTDIHASDRAHERTGASVDRTVTAASGAGVASRTFRVGQHVSGNSKFYTDLSGLPSTVQSTISSQYPTNAYRYIDQTNRVYVIDRSTSKVVAVVNVPNP